MTQSINLKDSSSEDLAQAAKVIRSGGVVAFPTETYYGLAVDPFNPEALDRLFRLKRRDINKPVLTLVHSVEELSLLAKEIPSVYHPLMRTFWPGPLTLVFDGLSTLPSLLTGNTGTVGVRISSNGVAQRLAEAVRQPITATSANISGQPPAINAKQVEEQFGRDIDLVVDGGETHGGAGSTIIGVKKNELVLIRSGVLSYERIVGALDSRE